MFIIQFIRGFCMALADSVPGVSGGTIAFLLGFYDKFIDSIDDLLTGTKEERKDAFVFLIKLGIGWISGISGSTLLLIFGVDLPIITAIKDMLHLDFSSFWTVVIFGCGVLVGIFSVVKLIRRALEKYRAQTIYLIIGLMLGSIFAVVMGPTTLDTPQPAMGIHDFSILFFLIGGAVILGLQKMKDIKQ